MKRQKVPPDGLSEQEAHVAVFTEMAELCAQRGDHVRAAEYRNMVRVTSESSWERAVLIDRTGASHHRRRPTKINKATESKDDSSGS